MKIREKPCKLFDGLRLYCITPKGQRWWRFKYQANGKETLLSLGTYPDVALKQASASRDELRRSVAAGVDPSLQRCAKQEADYLDNLCAGCNVVSIKRKAG